LARKVKSTSRIHDLLVKPKLEAILGEEISQVMQA